MSPYVARVGGHEEREVPDQPHAFGAGVGLQSPALTEQLELSELNPLDIARQIPSRAVERNRRAANQLFRPLEIGGAVVLRFERAEQSIVVEPVSLMLDEALKGRLQIRARAALEVPPRRLQQRGLEPPDGFEVDGGGRKRSGDAVARLHEFVFDQPVRADEERVPGERRQGLIWRIAVSGRTQWQRLPPSLARLVELVDPGDGGWPEVADPIRRRQRRDVHEQAGRSVLRREWRQTHGSPLTAQ